LGSNLFCQWVFDAPPKSPILKSIIDRIPYKVSRNFKGADLVDIRYEQLMQLALPYQNPENAFRVIAGEFVTIEDGTGIVHTAPTFGADDAKVAKEATPEVPPMLVLDAQGNPVPLVDLQGKFIESLGDYGGKYVKNEYYNENEAPERSVDVEIAIQLKEENKAFKVEKYVHSYPHCWRTDKPILYYPLDSWFIKMTEVKERMFELNDSINWKPKATGEGRFGNWLKNANDWNLSRSRYWGIPLPIWRSKDGKDEILIGSVEKLYHEIEKSIAAGFMTENPYQGFEIGNMDEANYDKIMKTIRSIQTLFQKSFIVFVESNSTDNTVEHFSKVENAIFIHLENATEHAQRNAYLSFVNKNRRQFDCMMVMDTQIVGKPLDKRIFSCFESSKYIGWDAVFANQSYKYYDIKSLRCNEKIKNIDVLLSILSSTKFNKTLFSEFLHFLKQWEDRKNITLPDKVKDLLNAKD
jgi:isoleucyl-tRNA synthetase